MSQPPKESVHPLDTSKMVCAYLAPAPKGMSCPCFCPSAVIILPGLYLAGSRSPGDLGGQQQQQHQQQDVTALQGNYGRQAQHRFGCHAAPHHRAHCASSHSDPDMPQVGACNAHPEAGNATRQERHTTLPPSKASSTIDSKQKWPGSPLRRCCSSLSPLSPHQHHQHHHHDHHHRPHLPVPPSADHGRPGASRAAGWSVLQARGSHPGQTPWWTPASQHQPQGAAEASPCRQQHAATKQNVRQAGVKLHYSRRQS